MLSEPVDVQVDEKLSLEQATEIAQAKARELHSNVMLLAWFHRTSGEYSPHITC
jgi:hypothetical protein